MGEDQQHIGGREHSADLERSRPPPLPRSGRLLQQQLFRKRRTARLDPHQCEAAPVRRSRTLKGRARATPRIPVMRS